MTEWFPAGRLVLYAFSAGFIAGTLGLLWLFLSTSRGLRYTAERRNGEGASRTGRAAFVTPSKWIDETERLRKRLEYAPLKLYTADKSYGQKDCHPISEKIDALLSKVQRDYVQSWHGKISGRSLFTNEVDSTIRTALVNILNRLSSVDVADVTVSRLLPVLTVHVRDFSEAERIVKSEKFGATVTDSSAFDRAVASRFRNGITHQAVCSPDPDSRDAQHRYLRKTVLRILPLILPPSMMTSSLACVLIQEVLAGAVLLPLMQMLTDPDFWNQLIASQVSHTKLFFILLY